MAYDLELLKAKLHTVNVERHAGRGDWDRLSALEADLRKAIAEMEAALKEPT